MVGCRLERFARDFITPSGHYSATPSSRGSMTIPTNTTKSIWESIDREKRRDRLLTRVSIAAWTATLVLVTVLLVVGAISVGQMVRAALAGAVPSGDRARHHAAARRRARCPDDADSMLSTIAVSCAARTAPYMRFSFASRLSKESSRAARARRRVSERRSVEPELYDLSDSDGRSELSSRVPVGAEMAPTATAVRRAVSRPRLHVYPRGAGGRHVGWFREQPRLDMTLSMTRDDHRRSINRQGMSEQIENIGTRRTRRGPRSRFTRGSATETVRSSVRESSNRNSSDAGYSVARYSVERRRNVGWPDRRTAAMVAATRKLPSQPPDANAQLPHHSLRESMMSTESRSSGRRRQSTVTMHDGAATSGPPPRVGVHHRSRGMKVERRAHAGPIREGVFFAATIGSGLRSCEQPRVMVTERAERADAIVVPTQRGAVVLALDEIELDRSGRNDARLWIGARRLSVARLFSIGWRLRMERCIGFLRAGGRRSCASEGVRVALVSGDGGELHAVLSSGRELRI